MKTTILRKLTLSAVFAALLSITAPLSVQIGTIPISLATFSVYLAAFILTPLQSAGAVVCYLVLGAVGMPVFSGFFGGFSRITSPSGGFLIGYIPCALITSFISRRLPFRGRGRIVGNVISAYAGSVVCHVCGVLYFMLVTRSGLAETFVVCVIPFVLPELIKIMLASYLAFLLNKRMKHLI